MDFLKDNNVVLTVDPIMEKAFRDWALRFCGVDDVLVENKSGQGYIGGYSFAEREAFRSAVEKMLD